MVLSWDVLSCAELYWDVLFWVGKVELCRLVLSCVVFCCGELCRVELSWIVLWCGVSCVDLCRVVLSCVELCWAVVCWVVLSCFVLHWVVLISLSFKPRSTQCWGSCWYLQSRVVIKCKLCLEGVTCCALPVSLIFSVGLPKWPPANYKNSIKHRCRKLKHICRRLQLLEVRCWLILKANTKPSPSRTEIRIWHISLNKGSEAE